MMHIKFKTSNKRHWKGFTLIETLVAITMLSIVIAAVSSIIQMSLAYGTYSKDEITAKYLAEEGVEYIRNLRDLNVVDYGQSSWMNGIAHNSGDPCGNITVSGFGKFCEIDSIGGSIPVTCTGTNGTCDYLKYNISNGQYSYTTGITSKFRRTIKIEAVDGGANPYSVLVQVTVDWNENSGPQTYTVSEYLFDWYNGN